MKDYQSAFIDFLWDAGALKIGEFQLKSGRISPLYLNTGLLDSGKSLIHLGRGYAATLAGEVGADAFDVVFGPAYKGIPLAVATAMGLAELDMDKAFLADRKEAKVHGAEAAGGSVGKRLLGRPPNDDARFVLVDDVLTDGATKREAVALLKEIAPKCTVAALLIVLDRQETLPDGRNAVSDFAEKTGVRVIPVVTTGHVVEHLRATDRLSDDDLKRIRAYWTEYGTSMAKTWVSAIS